MSSEPWSWLNVQSIPMLVIVPILPAFGIFILVSIIEFIICNKKLSKSGHVTKAQIVQKYERGSINYYKADTGKSFFFVCEFMTENPNTHRFMLCQSKFIVDQALYNNHQAGDFMNVTYLPRKHRKYHNLQALNKDVVDKKTIAKRICIALLIIFLVPMLIAIFAKSWTMFIMLLLIGLLYYVVACWMFLCCCPNKTWFKNKGFKQRVANQIDFTRFDMDMDQEQHVQHNRTRVHHDGNINATLLGNERQSVYHSIK